jgi:uncharacterized protein (DUF983 family)
MNIDRSWLDSLQGVLQNLCPRCLEGKVFSGVFKMNETCSHCHLKYEREHGYFVGAMSLSYSIGFIVVLPIFLILLFKDVELPYVIGISAMVLTLMSPLSFRLSRLIWLHLNYRVHRQDFEDPKPSVS